jgi:hypothetical protein
MLNLLLKFLTLGAIINPLPNNIVDGTIIDAVPVMANFNWIVSQVNANAAAGNVINATSIPTFVPAASVGGTANAITLAPTPAITSYAQGQSFVFPAGASSTGAVTIATNGLSTRALKYADGTNMTGSELLSGATYQITDNGSNYILMNAAQGSSIVNWTPVLSFGGASVGITYSTQSGIAFKLGRLVFMAFDITLTSKGSSTGQMAIAGLPYTVNASWVGNNGGPVVTSNMTYTGQLNLGYSLGTTTCFILNSASTASYAILADTNFANNTIAAASMFYST